MARRLLSSAGAVVYALALFGAIGVREVRGMDNKIPATTIADRNAETPVATGQIAGIVSDTFGAVIAGAKVKVLNPSTGLKKNQVTDQQGHFVFTTLPPGRYQVTIAARGFDSGLIPSLDVQAGREVSASLTLKVATLATSVEVKEQEGSTLAATSKEIDAKDQGHSRNTAEIVAQAPGVSLRTNGELASVPMLHGMGDERTKIVVDGMTVSSSCPNHMNPPLSYTAPVEGSQIKVFAGIAPVSLGGDSTGGTISVESPLPVFAEAGGGLREEGNATGFYRSNGNNYGSSVREWIAGQNLGIGYSGFWGRSDDYTDGSGHKITSTYSQSTDHVATLAARLAGNLFVLQAGLHHTPYEGFVNAQMDMVRNYADSLNLRYRRAIGKGTLDANVFWQNSFHEMNIGDDKSNFPMPMSMPMDTHGKDLGYTARYEVPLSARHLLRVGSELHRFVLNDRWPPVDGSAPYMAPNYFVNINNGHRLRLGSYVETFSKWSSRWSTLLGIRNDTVWTNAGQVQGYSDMYSTDAAALNAAKRARNDANIDLTALARYDANASTSFEFGYARKSRAPNLYERYAWSTNWMASGMIGWFGDGNYYVGNVALKPEVAHTISGTLTVHGHGAKSWEVKLTPYFTHVEDYIDVNTLATTTYGMSTFAQLQFANHSARIYGGDLSGRMTLWKSDRFGQGQFSGVGSWVHGTRIDTGAGLYQMMPLNARLSFDEELKGVNAGFGVEAVDRKSRVDPNRLEQVTPGYTLFSVHAGYRRRFLQGNVNIANLFNRTYELPLGGVNFDDYMASGWMSKIQPLTGRGRSVSVSLTANF